MNIKFLKSSEKKKLLEELEKIYGITNLPYLLFETGKKKIRGFSGDLTKEELIKLGKTINIELIGVYFISKKDNTPRINFDALTLFKDQISKSIIEIEKSQLDNWIRGTDLDIKTKKGLVILKHKDDLVGIGKSNGDKIFNYLPKERTIKTTKITYI